MALTEKQIEQIRDELLNCKNPLFFYHDDPDGLCSFLILYRYIREGRGVIVKAVPRLDEKFIRKVEEHSPDKIFALDLAMVEQEFIDQARVPVVWVDHHMPLVRHNVKYFNPRINDSKDNTPVTRLCYEVTKQDMWLAMAGCIGDWYLPDFFNEFILKYPDLTTALKDPGEIYFKTELGKLVRILSFILKGKTEDALKCVKILTRIKTPYEILRQENAAGRFIYKRYDKINQAYNELLQGGINKKTDDRFIVYIYKNKMSFTGDLANELTHMFPEKVIIIGRENNGEVKMSLRAHGVLLPPLIDKSLIGINGYGGGHEYACGANVKIADFEKFIDNLRKNIGYTEKS